MVARVDLRSDTVTQPTEAMRRAMAGAEVGDDVFGEDPTVNGLQERAAELLGKQAGLFIPSGTMGNRLGTLVNVPYGHALIAESTSHIFIFEAGGAAAVGGVQIMPVATDRGVITPAQLTTTITPSDPHFPPTAAVAVEDTHNRHGGAVWPMDALHDLADTAHARGLRVHLDGARIFNAAVALGVPVRDIAACADTLTFCLSKGLSCPVGSVFCGSADAVAEATRWRKMLGGGMRQAGIIAAAGLVALDTMIDRLADDHRNARTLAEALSEMPGVHCDPLRVETNMVFIKVDDARSFVTACAADGLLGSATAPDTIRFVTHHGVEPGDVQRAIDICARVARNGS